MKGDIYQYEGKEFVLKGLYFDEYLVKTGVDKDKKYSKDDASNIINANVISIYRGIFHCQKSLTGEEICNVLSDMREQFEIRINVVCSEE